MRAGDEIVAIDGRRDLSLTTMTLKVALSGQGQVLHFDVKRPGHEGLIEMDIQPRRETGPIARRSACMARPEPESRSAACVPAGMKNPPDVSPGRGQGGHGSHRHPGRGRAAADRDPTPVEDIRQYHRLLARFSQPADRPRHRTARGDLGCTGKGARSGSSSRFRRRISSTSGSGCARADHRHPQRLARR